MAMRILVAAEPLPQPVSPPAHKTPAGTYFSGTVTNVKPDSISVVRKLPAKDPVFRSFVIDGRTTVEGRIQENARVTVRYASQDDGTLRAIHIIVRQ